MSTWPTKRTCDRCAADFLPKSSVQVYCSSRCRESAKYDRLRSDPDRWDSYLARLRSKYEPKGTPPGPTPQHAVCQIEGCDGKHLARGLCLKHYRRDRYKRGLDRRSEPEIIAALVKHYDESGQFVEVAFPRRITAKIAGPLLLPECPDCGAVMVRIPTDQDLDLRDCGKCRVRASLNMEEVAWLTSATPSTRPPRPTPSS